MRCIDADELDKALAKECEDCIHNQYDCEECDFLIARLYINAAPTIEAEPVNDWINVDDRLPEKDGRYLVYTSCIANYRPLKDNVFVARLVNRNWVFEGWEFNRVTHWQPLPKPPR